MRIALTTPVTRSGPLGGHLDAAGPLLPDGGMAPHPVPVRWEVARDVRMRHDFHSSWAANILENFDDPGAGIVVAEFVGTSITSDFPAGLIPAVQVTLSDNAHIRYFDGLHRG